MDTLLPVETGFLQERRVPLRVVTRQEDQTRRPVVSQHFFVLAIVDSGVRMLHNPMPFTLPTRYGAPRNSE